MTEHKFTVIKGGNTAVLDGARRGFVSAYVTDTRLMGVLVLYIHWDLTKSNYSSDLHQFFYFDAEEQGLETYKSLIGDDQPLLAVTELTLLGGLGGNKVELSEGEARFLVQQFAAANKKASLPLPDPQGEYGFLLTEPALLSSSDQQLMIQKLCTPIVSVYQLINYFLMRSFGKDQTAIPLLVAEGAQLEDLSGEKPATLYKNTINEFEEYGQLSYLCESLIEYDGKYRLVVSEVTTKDLKITSASRKSAFTVSPAEAAMLLNRPEFLTVYEILADLDEFELDFLPLMAGAMQSAHDSGQLFLDFNKHNEHVNQKVFRLNDDIHGLFFLSDYGQLIISAFDLPTIQSIERSLKSSIVESSLLLTSKYEFKEPVLYEFIQSDFEDFTEFLETLRGLDDEDE